MRDRVLIKLYYEFSDDFTDVLLYGTGKDLVTLSLENLRNAVSLYGGEIRDDDNVIFEGVYLGIVVEKEIEVAPVIDIWDIINTDYVEKMLEEM